MDVEKTNVEEKM